MIHYISPEPTERQSFTDPAAAVARLEQIYNEATQFLCDQFVKVMQDGPPEGHIRAYYPEIRVTTRSYAQVDTRFSFGHVAIPGTYATTVTRPDLFRSYLTQQITLLIRNHGQPVTIGASKTPLPVHFAMTGNPDLTVPQEGATDFILRDVFDVPDLSTTNDDIVNGTFTSEEGIGALALFTASA